VAAPVDSKRHDLTESSLGPRQPVEGAFVGVFDPFRTDAGERLRGRLEIALGSDRSADRFDQGPLSVAWTEAISCARPEANGDLCLLDGYLQNRAALSAELGLPSRSDVATLAAAHATLGPAMLEKLRGDFTVLLWSPRQGAGLIARDQLGARGLFYCRFSRGIAFASEVRNLIRLLPNAPEPDQVAVAHWLVPAVIPEGRTIHAGVEPLAPASCLTLGEGAVTASRYWRPEYRQRAGLSVASAGEEVRVALGRALERRSGSSASTAVLLSGGIDSAGVAGVAVSALPQERRPRSSYSAIFPDHPQIDEAPMIAAVAADTGLRATALRLDSGGLLLGAIPFIERGRQLPPTPNLFFLHPLLSRAAEDGVRVLLDGEGGDAVFWYSTALLAERLRRGRFLSAWSLAGRFPEYGRPTTLRTRFGQLRQWGRRRDFRPQPPSWLSVAPALLDGGAPTEEWDGPAWWSAQVEGILGPGSRMLHDTSRRHAALSGIEPRHPLLDVDLIELALSIPPELAFDRRFNRPVLRQAVDGLVPEEVRVRPYKSNFDPVLVAGVKADLPVLERLLLDADAEVAAYADRRLLRAYLDSPPTGAGQLREWALTIWNLATTECWLRGEAGRDLVPKDLLRRLKPARYSFTQI
jgi:asparagine synthase (glutamine-hydrolysing)